jgi:ParB-like chromosome segregation protein Spo0J
MSGGSLLSNASLFELSPHHVDEGQRIGFLHEDKAAALGRLMAVDGQRDPIKVVANQRDSELPWRLVTGMHRLIGARVEGITVWAIEVKGKPEELADLEASENLHRRPLAPIERAKFTAALVQAAQERIARQHGGLKQQQRAIRARWDRVKRGESRAEEALKDELDDTSGTLQRVYGWEEAVGEALGMSRDNIYRDLRLFRLIIEPFSELVEPLSRHPVVGENGAQLKAIAAIKDEAHRRKVIEQLLADPELSADDARVQAGLAAAAGPTPLPYEKHYNAIKGGWSRLGRAERERFVRDGEIVKLLTPSLMRELRNQIDAELGDD